MNEPQIQRGAYNKTPQRAERQQAPGFDPNAFMQMLQMMQQGTQQNIAEAKKPVGQISQSPQNRPRYDIMNDPNYKPGINPQYGRIGEDKPVAREAAAPVTQQAPQQPGIMDVLGNALRGLLGGGQQQQQQGPRINSLTGLPFGTLPGDAGYPQEQQVPQGQPQSHTPAGPAMSQTGQDAMSALQKLFGGNALGDLRQANNMADAYGQPTQQEYEMAFGPGGPPIGELQGPPKELASVEGFNQPIQQPQRDPMGNRVTTPNIGSDGFVSLMAPFTAMGEKYRKNKKESPDAPLYNAGSAVGAGFRKFGRDVRNSYK
jgi:hypothetical protein